MTHKESSNLGNCREQIRVRITILGSGNIGGTLGGKWAKAGHEVVFGVRDVNSPKVQALLGRIEGTASADTVANAIAFGDVVLFATPWSAVEGIAKENAEALNGKILIDASNDFGGPVVNNVGTISAKGPGAKVFRAFNSLGWENFEDPRFGDTQVDLFYCGPDDEARAVVEALIKDVGLRPIWVGDLDQVHVVDAVGSLWVTLAFRRGMGRRLAFKLVTE
jgi:predicted dinucleotide-binding enzyme